MMENCWETFRGDIQFQYGSKSTTNQQQILAAAASSNTCLAHLLNSKLSIAVLTSSKSVLKL